MNTTTHTHITPDHRDIEAWLSAKLEDAWSSEKLSSLLTNDILQHAKTKFSSMDTSIKLKLLQSFISLRKKPFKDMEEDVRSILQLAVNDEDEWVKILGGLLQTLNQDRIAVECIQGLEKMKIMRTCIFIFKYFISLITDFFEKKLLIIIGVRTIISFSITDA